MAKACMILPKQRRIVGCNIDTVCFNASLPYPERTFAWQVLSDYSDMNGSAEVFAEATKVSVCDRWNPGDERKGDVRCTGRTTCDAASSGSCCTLHVPLFNDPSPFGTRRNVPVVKGCEKWRGAVQAGREDGSGCEMQSTRGDVKDDAD